MKHKLLFVLMMALYTTTSFADEGMWMLGSINKPMQATMHDLGLKIPFDKVYSPKHNSLSNAVVNFGGFCSGVVVSADGLVFTNHHCGFNSIQQHSSVEHDYTENGFVAQSLSEELPNPELYVRFLIRSEDVTKRILSHVPATATEYERGSIIDSLSYIIANEVALEDSTLIGVVDSYYAGNEYWLSVYRDYEDVRLVFAPPASIGKFGWDTDNWMWPRHTGDFCVFRIYAGKDNQPASYSTENIPYQPSYVAPISLSGYQEGSFCMTMGYPGTTERYLSSYGIEEMMKGVNQSMIDMRGIKQDVWKNWMNHFDEIRIQYAAKYAESSNYWKNSIGKNQSIKALDIIEKKKMQERTLEAWINHHPEEKEKLDSLFIHLERAYASRDSLNKEFYFYVEAFLNSVELIQLSLETLNFDFEADSLDVERNLMALVQKYNNYEPAVDKDVFANLLKQYPHYMKGYKMPPLYDSIKTYYANDIDLFVNDLYEKSEFTNMNGLRRFLERDSTYSILDDMAVTVTLDALTYAMELNHTMEQSNEEISKGERLLNSAMRRMYATNQFYPDANFSMRLSFGTIQGYKPYDGAFFNYYTTPLGIVEKSKKHNDDADFKVSPELLELFSQGNYGRYADKNGEMRVCFISNNDITGGNSGSAMFNGEGELIGLAFDGNWEAMSSDIAFNPQMQRCIGVDVRYMLFVIEQYGKASHIINELTIQ